jgi:hypothetical protein
LIESEAHFSEAEAQQWIDTIIADARDRLTRGSGGDA